MKLNNKGFTLIELLAAIAIIVLLTIVVAPTVINTLNTGKDKSYDILVNNIVTASKELYEEIYSNKLLGVSGTPNLHHYNADGSQGSEIIISSNSIETNLQTLVSNGFLSGSEDNNTKVITNPKTDSNEKIGDCRIKITRNSSNGKVTYTITDLSVIDKCPTTAEYKKGVS